MPAEWQTIHARGQQTAAVWQQFAPAFTVGGLTLALHSTDVGALPGAGQARETQQDQLDAARAARDGVMAFVRDLSIRMPRRLEGELAAEDALHLDIGDVRTIEPNTLTTIEARGQRVVSLWNKANAARAAAAPPLPALLIGTTTAAQFAAAVADLAVKEQAVEDARAVLSDVRSDLRALSLKVDRNNKRWFAAWEGNFPIGTPEHDALSQIDTGGGPTPMPTPVEIAFLFSQGGGASVLIHYAPGGGEHASSIVLQYKFAADADFGHDVPVEPTPQSVGDLGFQGELVEFRTKATNATGTVFSAVQSLQF